MSALPKKKWSAEEYLAIDRASQERHELVNGEIYVFSPSRIYADFPGHPSH